MPDIRFNSHSTTISLELKDQVLSGKEKLVYEGEEKVGILYRYKWAQEWWQGKALVRFISAKNPNLSISDATISDVKVRDKAVEVNSSISIANQVVKTGSELYVNLDIENEYAGMVIDTNRFYRAGPGFRFYSRIQGRVKDSNGI